MEHPEFKGSMNAMVPCENTCFSDSDQMRTDLRACFANDCFVFLGCATTAGLKLMPQMLPDASMPDQGDASMPDQGSAD